MIKKFRTFILGGDTDKRESALFAFLLWFIITVGVSFMDARNVIDPPVYNLSFAKEMIKFSASFVFAWLAAAHSLEFVGKHTKYGTKEK